MCRQCIGKGSRKQGEPSNYDVDLTSNTGEREGRIGLEEGWLWYRVLGKVAHWKSPTFCQNDPAFVLLPCSVFGWEHAARIVVLTQTWWCTQKSSEWVSTAGGESTSMWQKGSRWISQRWKEKTNYSCFENHYSEDTPAACPLFSVAVSVLPPLLCIALAATSCAVSTASIVFASKPPVLLSRAVG